MHMGGPHGRMSERGCVVDAVAREEELLMVMVHRLPVIGGEIYSFGKRYHPICSKCLVGILRIST